MDTFEGLYKALKNPDVKKIGVYGMAGIGKTVVAKQVAAQAGTDKTFDFVLFVEISRTPDIKRI
ncbi:hypothetical protein Pint_26099 [Pistacia integerrima]|uniref:Uncharacterized protein n=1 Tax=Pistacia integerrima TaxID=434235 RepID=A0ACC0YF79_9ROSI|nr:hypothetical protein Pint_26099 [Pistacia integerrima]